MLIARVASIVSEISEHCSDDNKVHHSMQIEICRKISEESNGRETESDIEHKYLTMLMDEGFTEVARRLAVYFYLNKKLKQGDTGLFSIMNSMIEINKYNEDKEKTHEQNTINEEVR